ncbi:BRO-N domain-containing protein [Marinobacter oulmenensis]|uniref:Prophage antirepressor-like protein n=1 Tax=Marinobacter oulmenensis TaxID=643747 RepID=A0A840UKD5_9GAMM|nr:Bro-N domain-containing protein [Marinobacter oulmenensis]MBB5321198.1 prophage antirepressor-like protein [Marinobacter oulmenensis]
MHNHTQGAPAPLVYAFTSTDLRVILIEGQIWFAAADVAAALGYRMTSDMTRNLDDDEKGTHIMRTPGGNQEITVINESGLYCCVLKSRKPEAKKFKRWVTHEVLPTIRKTGSYGKTHWPPTDRASYQLREQLSAAIRSITVGFRGKGAAYAVNERIRNHFGVRRVEDLTTQQAKDAIFMVEQLRPLAHRWVKAMNQAEKDFTRQVLRTETGPMLSAPTLVCLDIDANGITTPLEHPNLKKLQKANQGMHDMLALFQDEEE